MTKEELQEVILINNIPYYLIRNGTTYDYAPIPKEFKIYFDRLQQENKELHNKIDKAIKYINSIDLVTYDYALDTEEVNNLLGILEG